ncbi:MAG: hypothetical protein JW697_08615, partial [Kosmotogaceae bacterium]|nr:hypothetical protein [Kosmotogaceae bacterium]
MFFEGALAALLSDDDVEVQILDGTTPLFTGYVRPVSSFEFSGKGAGDTIKVECLGASDRLRGTHSGAMIDYGDDVVVCSPDDTAHSFIHQIVSLMGWTRGVTAPSILVALPIARLAPNTDLQKKLEKVLFDCGFYYTDRPDGSIEILPFAVESPESHYEFSVANGNIIRSTSIKRADDAERAVIVGYRKLNKVDDYVIYSETVRQLIWHTDAQGYTSYTLAGKTFKYPFEQDENGLPPIISSATMTTPYDSRYSQWRKKCNLDGSLSTEEDCLFPFAAPDVDGLDIGFWKYTDTVATVTFSLQHIGSLETIWEAHIASDGSVAWENKNLSRYKEEYQEYYSVPPFNNIVTAEWTANGLILKIETPVEMLAGYFRMWICGVTITGSIEYLHNNMEADEDEAAPRWYEGPRVESEKCKSLVADHLQQPA